MYIIFSSIKANITYIITVRCINIPCACFCYFQSLFYFLPVKSEMGVINFKLPMSLPQQPWESYNKWPTIAKPCHQDYFTAA